MPASKNVALTVGRPDYVLLHDWNNAALGGTHLGRDYGERLWVWVLEHYVPVLKLEERKYRTQFRSADGSPEALRGRMTGFSQVPFRRVQRPWVVIGSAFTAQWALR